LKAAFELAKLEGIIPALESAHALAALHQMKFKTSDNVVVCLSGRGDKDLATYMKAMALKNNIFMSPAIEYALNIVASHSCTDRK
jgi:tryptophan synthase beta subunit